MIRKSSKREAAFYREQLELIAADKRKTRAQCIAWSALSFWDELQIDRRINRLPNTSIEMKRKRNVTMSRSVAHRAAVADSVQADVRRVFPRLGPWCKGCLQQGDGVCMIHSCVRFFSEQRPGAERMK
jgi:hypothetical protein